MSFRILRVFLALGLALSVLAGTLVTGAADEHGNGDGVTNQSYLPWVPNGSVLDDPREDIESTGPYSGAITVQNLESETVTVQYDVLATGHSDTIDVDGWATYTLTAAELFNDSDVNGSGVVLSTVEGERIAAVQKQSSPAGPDAEARTSAEHEIVAGYTALTGGDVGADIVLPIVQTNNFWNTHVRLTNFGDATATVEMTLHPAGGDTEPLDFTLDVEAGQTATFDLLENEVPVDWVGSARISADQPVGAVAERVKNLTNMLIMNTSKSVDDGANQYAPLVFHDWHFWNTGISIANLADAENEVTISYYSREGELSHTDTLIVPANGMDYQYTPTAGLAVEDGFVGSAVISGEYPFRGSVDEVKYIGDDPDTGHAMSYMVEDQAAGMNETLALPIFQSGSPDGSGDTSGIQLFNPTDEWVAGAVRFITQFGVEYRDPLVVHLEPGEGYTVYPHDIPDFPADVHGSALVQVYAGDGAITAVSNNVNYSVMHDGSASFNLALAGEAGPGTPEYILRTDPRWATNAWQEPFSLTATLLDVDGNPLEGEEVLIMVNPSIEGPPGDARVLETDASGQVVFNDEFTRGGSEFVDRFIVIYPAYDPSEAPPDEARIETYAWKTWVAPGPEPDASIDVVIVDEDGNPFAEGDTITIGDQVTVEATVLQDGEPLANQEVSFDWAYSPGPGAPEIIATEQNFTDAQGVARDSLTVETPNVFVHAGTTIDGWPLGEWSVTIEVE